ncbi:MAG: hypothetical protein MUE40_02305 [Anaerolineae bacterium]|jgi:hypothetical protein|nr:hypothetical protein [Anaerolineae bacterium]
MDYSQSLTYVLEDKQRLPKLALLALLLAGSLLPGVGLLPLALCLGALVQIIGAVRNGQPRPLPAWQDVAVKLRLGAPVLLALLLYNLPLLALLGLLAATVWTISGGFLGWIVNLVLLCCAVPLIVLYTAVAWSLLAIAVTEYAVAEKRPPLYRLAHLYDVLRTHPGLTLQWGLAATAVNLAALLLLLLPVLGWLVVAALYLPVQGHLLGQYARLLAVPRRG